MFNPAKKRFWILLAVIGMVALQFVLPPVRPYIQLPGEIYPGSDKWPIVGDFFGGWTNTFTAALIAWSLLILLAYSLRAGSRRADEVPSGFYNFFEMVFEGLYNFAENIAGPKRVKAFFPLFFTYILYILTANWMGLVPGVDSIGFWEHKPTFALHKEEKVAEAEGTHFDSATFCAEEDAANHGDLRSGIFLLRASKFAVPTDDAPIEAEHSEDAEHKEDQNHKEGEVHGCPEQEGMSSQAADWTIVPFLRPAATDLNFTLAFALIAMFMVQYFGVSYLGARGYFSKFFPFIGKGWSKEVAKNPIKAIDPAVGILELISEISKVISFAFRLLGNIFAGMVLLFVMAYLLPAANIVFFGLEFFVGLIQAIVFGLLMLIFMVSATEHHGGGDHGEEHH